MYPDRKFLFHLTSWIESFKGKPLSKLLKTYKINKVKIANINADIAFNTRCLKNEVFPNFIKNSFTHYKGDKKLKNRLMNVALQWEINQKYIVRDALYRQLMYVHLELVHNLHPWEFEVFTDTIDNLVINLTNQRRARHQRKYERLTSSSQVNSVSTFNPRVINLTTTVFTDREISLLNQGIKFTPNPINQVENLMELAISANEKLTEPPLIHSVCNKIDNHYVETRPQQNGHDKVQTTIRSIKKKIKQDNIIVTKADKSNALVLLDDQAYRTKVDNFLQLDMISTCPKDPTDNICKELRKVLQQSLLTEKPAHLMRMNPEPPKLHGYIKTHKASKNLPLTSVPIRPVVSACNSPTYTLEKFLVKLFKTKVNWTPTYSIKNSTDLAHRLKDVHLPSNAKLISLDVDSLFTNVDVTETVSNLSDILKNNSQLSTSEISEFCRLTTFVTNNNYFEYQGTFYKLSEGLPMGAPISPLLADIFLSKYDEIIVEKLTKWKNKIHTYFRYVDDTILIWTGTVRELNCFVAEINRMKPKLKYTLEVGGKSLNFLDLKISIVEGKLEFGIYRKPGYTDVVIPSNSFHSYQHKMSAFHALVNRLLNIPLSKKEYRKELDTILQIANNNGYKTRDILSIVRKKKSRIENRLLFNAKTAPQTEPTKWISLPYTGEISEDVRKMVSKKDYRVTFSNSPNLGTILTNAKGNKTDVLSNSGIYKISCPCGSHYVGQTGRDIKTRTREHLSSARLQKMGNSSLADHLISSNHPWSECNVELMKRCQKGRRMNLYEQLEINLARSEKLLNSQIESEVTNLITPPTIFREFKSTRQKRSSAPTPVSTFLRSDNRM